MPTCFLIQPFDSGKYDKRIQANESRFVLHRLDKPKNDEKVPF
jgi:hypothetical protein